MSMASRAADETKIYVCGTKITGSTTFSAGGGTVSYNASSRTLTLTNVNYTKTGSSNNGISVDAVPGTLNIYMEGTVKFDIGDADAVLCKSQKTTYIYVNGTATFLTRSSGHAGLKLQDGDVYVYGAGTLTVENAHSSSGYAIKGGAKNENLYLQIKNATIKSKQSRLYHLNKVTINPRTISGSDDYSTKIQFIKYGSSYHASDIGSWSAGTGVKIFEP